MPLTYTKKPSKKLFRNIGQKVSVALAYLRPDNLLVGLLVIAVILAFLKSPIGFYIVASVFIICYFGERIAKILHRKRDGQEKQQQQKK